MAAPSEAPVTRQVSGHAAPAPVPSGPESWQPLAAAVAELPVLDASGRPVPFGELFRERRAVVVFVRVSAGDGTIRRSDLTCRQGRRLFFQGLPWRELHRASGMVQDRRTEPAGPGSSSSSGRPLKMVEGGLRSRFLERERKSSPPSQGHFLSEPRGLTETGWGPISEIGRAHV